MIFVVLLLLKVLLFMNITVVRYNSIQVFLLTGLFILFIYSLIYLSKRKNKDIIGLVIYFVFSIILFADVLHHTYFNALPSVKMLSQLHQVGAVKDSVKSIFTLKNILMILDIPFMISLIVFNRRNNWGFLLLEGFSKNTKKSIKIGIPIIILISISAMMFGLVKTENYYSVANQELFLYHARDIKNSLKGEAEAVDLGIEDGEEALKDLKERARLKDGKHTGIGKDKNLIVIQVEALQNFVINMKYNNQVITPNLNKLIKDQGTIYFDNYYQLIGRGNTSDAEFVTQNSIYPSMEEPSYTAYQDNKFYGLPWLLKDNGYTPWVFHGYKKEFWNREKAYKTQGFEKFISEEDFKFEEKDVLGFGINDEMFYEQSIPYLKELDAKSDNPFYAFMITLTSHNPFEMPEKYQVLDIEAKYKNTIFGNYLQSIHYADKELGKFIDMLKEEGLYEDTVIALYGDHFAISSAQEDAQKIMTDYFGEEYKVEDMMNIPMIIHVPGEKINEKVSKVGSQLDFYPTITNIMGIDNSKGIVFGRDLLNYEGESLVAPQTYALKGSFIDDDVVMNMSRDGVFENSTAYTLGDREEVSTEQCRDTYDKVISEINKADYIMKNNLMGDIIEGKEIVLGSRLEKEINIPETIKNTDSTDASIKEAVAEGYKAIKVNLRYDFDQNRIVLGENESMRKLVRIMKDNEDLIVVANVENEEEIRTVYRVLKEDYKHIKDRIYPEINRLNVHQSLISDDFEAMIDVTGAGLSDRDVMDHIKRYNVHLVSMDAERAKDGLAKKLNEIGVSSYIYNVDSKFERFLLDRKGVTGIFTNELVSK